MAEVVRSVKIPVTIKIRIGRTPEENIAPRVVQLAKENGIAFATVHGRPASAGHGGAPNLAAVRETVDAGALQIAGNGGVTDELSAREFLETTGCDALMIGRAAIGDPRIFGRIEKYLSSGEMPPRAPWEERIGFLKEHAALAAEHYGEKHGIVLLRKVAPFYLKGLPNASRIRNEFNRITTLREVNLLIDSIWESPYFGEEASNE